MSIDTLKQQILAQNTTSKWSGEGFGSAEANAADMARILDSIGITDINQFGQFEKVTGTRQQTVLAETDSSYPGFEDTGYARPTGRYYIPKYVPENGEMVLIGKTYVDPSTVTERTVSHGFGTGPHYAASVPITETVYGNKVTGQVVPSTYGERQTGNAWGGTFAGSGNTGYRVQFDSAGNPYFYTTGASSSDLGSILPIASLALSFAVPGLGSAIGSALGASGAAATALGNAVIGGVMSEASGGDFLQGALTSGAGSLLGGVVNPAVTEAVGSQAVGNALTSGALSELQGGDFAQGALSGALSGAVSDAKLALAEDYINSIAPGTSYEADLPTSQDVIDVIAAEQPSYQVSDTTFTPDYSLNIGAPVVQDMGAQGIQAPTINEVIDVVNQPVDYSLPVPETNFELVMPTAPNIDAMGGGQGITVPVSGGTLTESGVIPDAYIPVLGDVASFINQPVPDSGVTTQEPAQVTEDISGKLAALDVAKALAPLAASALTAGAVVNAISDNSEQSGYPILPVPAEWKSPEYSMAFAPSAPIDFGSRALLRGTQWENPVNLSSLINTLNQPIISPQVNAMMTAFQAPEVSYQIGVNDVIGEINGKPISIADIISGIQSGQNYSS
jgi:hypothetical protein